MIKLANLTQISSWFKNQYPTLILDPEWLSSCTDYLQERFPNSTTTQLIKQTETQLLLSDLSTSSLQSPLPPPSPNNTNLFGPTRKFSHLVQVMSILEIAHSSLNLLQILESKREFRLEAIKRAGMGEAGALKDGEEARVEENWLRGMSRFKLSDGFREWEAIEYEKVSGLGLGEIKLGAKLLLNNVKSIKTILLLTPKCVIIKGHSVEELEEYSENILENTLRERLGMPLKELDENGRPLLPPPPSPRPAPAVVVHKNNQERQAVAGPVPKEEIKPRKTPASEPKPKIQQQQLRPQPRQQKQNQKQQGRAPSPNYFDDEDFDALLAEAEANEEEEEEGFDSEAERELVRLEEELTNKKNVIGVHKDVVQDANKQKGKEKIEEMELDEEEDDDLGLDGLNYKALPPPLSSVPPPSNPKKRLIPSNSTQQKKIKSELGPSQISKVQYLDLSSSPEQPSNSNRKPVVTSTSSAGSQAGILVKKEVRNGKLVEVLEISDSE